MVFGTMTNVFAAPSWGDWWSGSWPGYDNDDDDDGKKTYSHVSIGKESADGEYTLASKPELWYYDANDNKQKVELPNEYSHGKNGPEYESDSKYEFTDSTKFYIEATLTSGEKIKMDIVNTDDFMELGKPYYEYCVTNFCDANSGLDLKLYITDADLIKECTVTYKNGRTDLGTDTVVAGEDYTVVKKDITKKDYELVGWTDGTTTYKVGESFEVNESLTLTAVWAKLYTVTYKDGRTNLGSETVADGTEYTVVKKDITKNGYEFVGWTDGRTTYKVGESFKVNKNVTLTPVWEQLYTVTYTGDEDVKNLPTDNTAYKEGDEVLVSKAEPTKEGYRFKGWLYKNSLVGEKLTVGKSNIELKADWVKLYKIEYVVDNKVVYTKVVDAGTDVSDYDKYIYAELPENKNISDWSANLRGVNLKSINKDIVVSATTSTKTFTVTYYVDGVRYNENDIVVEYGKKHDLMAKPEYVDKNFSGWTVLDNADIDNVTENIVISGSTSVKTFVVVYKVNDTFYESFTVNYNDPLPTSTYEVEDGYDFSGWGYMPATVQQDLVFEGKATIKSYTVKFVNDNGDVVSSKEYTHGSQALTPDDPEKADLKVQTGEDAAKWIKYTFAKWEPEESKYSITDLNSITQDMTFKATYTENPVKVYYFVLNRDLAQPNEPASHSNKDYSKGVEGALKYFRVVNNNDAGVEEVIWDAPEAKDFGITLNDGEYIKWYVVKSVNDEKWHVDGIIVGQKYDVVVNYVDESGNKLCDSKTVSVAATEEYKVESPEIKGYELLNVNNAVVTGVMPYEKVEVTVEYAKTVYNVTYVDEAGVEVPVDEIAYTMDDTVVVKENLERAGYRFDGWSYNGKTYKAGDEIKVATENIVFTSNWTRLYTVTYMVDDEQVAQWTVDEGTNVSDYAKYVYKELDKSMNISDWTLETEDAKVEAIDMDIVISAKTSIKTFKVTYYLNGEKYNEEDIIVNYGGFIKLLPSPADAKAEEFSDWKVLGDAKIDYITQDIEIIGETWLKNFGVLYKVDGKLVHREEGLVYGDAVPVFEYVPEEGYEFSGWDNVPETVTEITVINGTTKLKEFTVTYKVDGEVVDEFTVEYGSAVPTSAYEVPEGYEFSGFELVTDVEGELVVKQDMVFEGTTSEIVVEEEEDLEIDTPFAPGVEEDDNDVDGEEEEDLEIDTPFAPGVEEDNNDADEEEDIDLATPFSSGVKTGDASNYTAYVAVLLIAAVGVMVVAYNKKKALN